MIEKNPDAVRAFLAGWFESVHYMREHKDQAVEIAARVTGVSNAVAARNYDELMPIFNLTGRFNPKALDVLATSFVEMGALPEKPDMSKLYTEQYLPK
jgi:ABC-type nitrate/sulfonate/bicarbonate transport system substrate-binding protein